MGLAEFAKVRSGGPAIALSLFVALMGSLTLAPALLCILGRVVFWPNGLPKVADTEKKEGLWTRLSRAVVKRPAWIWATAVIVLLPLAFLGFHVKSSYKATSELSSSSSSVQGLEAIQSHFTAGETGPLTVLLTAKTDWDSKEGRKLIQHLSQGFARLENVAEVRSLTQPLGAELSSLFSGAEAESDAESKSTPGPLSSFVKSMFSKMKNGMQGLIVSQAQKSAKKHYVSDIDQGRSVTRLDIILKSDPFDKKSVQTMNVVQTWLSQELPETVGKTVENLETNIYGVTVSSRDLAAVTESDRQRINVLVVIGILLILLVLVKKVWLASYLLITVLFSYYATLGATTLVSTWVHGRELGIVDWRVPFFLFTILVAVGEDYNIFLMTRAMKEGKRRGPIEGLRHALARTGGTITSCGLIMAGTFATLMLAGLGTLVQIGFALAFGVLLDTFVVRPILVPAFIAMVWGNREPEPEQTLLKMPQRDETSRRLAA